MIVNICSTKERNPSGYTCIDLVNADIIADLNEKWPLEDNSVDEILARDAIEHLKDPIHTMNEAWRVLKYGADFCITVPSTDGRGAFQDPTHVSFWNENSFLYYNVNAPAYLALCKQYGFNGAFSVETCYTDPVDAYGVCYVHAVLKKCTIPATT